MNQRGFTVVELLALILLLSVIGAVFWTQKSAIETSARDDERKTSINAMYYSLEEVFYKSNKYYPKTVTASTLPSVDPELFKDPDGKQIGTAESDYRYEGKNCDGDKCKGYSLRSSLEAEDDYVKQSRNQ